MTEHLDPESSMFLLALDDADAEKRAALLHAQTCSACTQLLQESRLLLERLDAEYSLPSIDAQLQRSIEAAIANAPKPLAQRLLPWGLLIGALSSLALAFIDGKPGRALEPMLGLRCLRFEQAFALGAFALGFAWTRMRGREFAAGPAALAAMGGALLGQSLLRVRCEAHDAALHLLVFHVLGVVLASLLGALGARLTLKTHTTR
jgi:hypothetical protein